MTVVATIPVGDLPIGFGRFISPADPNPPRLDAISTRMDVLTGDNVMIGGFIIGGSTPKTVVIRGRGPSLAAFGVADVAAPIPRSRLVRSSDQTVIATNDDWQGDAERGRPVSPAASRPAMRASRRCSMTLAPGAYTAIVLRRGRRHRRGRGRESSSSTIPRRRS